MSVSSEEHRLGQEATEAAYKMFSSAVYGGTGFGTILYKKADAVNKKRSICIRKWSIVGVVECNDFSFQNVEHFIEIDKFLRGQTVQQTVC